MLTYICLGSNDIARSTRFYDLTLAALDLNRFEEADESADDTENASSESPWDSWVGWMINDTQELVLWLCPPFNGKAATAGNGTMLALAAKSWDAVDAFHAAAIANGGLCEGPPGVRLHVSPDFYAAYVRDPDGNKLAAICQVVSSPDSESV